jgi:hypothetical protein
MASLHPVRMDELGSAQTGTSTYILSEYAKEVTISV